MSPQYIMLLIIFIFFLQLLHQDILTLQNLSPKCYRVKKKIGILQKITPHSMWCNNFDIYRSKVVINMKVDMQARYYTAWICKKDIIRLELRVRIYQKQRSIPIMGASSSWNAFSINKRTGNVLKVNK
eukprot:TRINITY_DN2335_c1_g1_i5.p7 TRINITY_DN2335_c1_g1~~TRINITY_DN2335_c1_g1_i5.p7  ORF type:complete len:128 (-),score=1.08 TRINITY_DN2335_c1_g1_i5:709-1092(-)